MLEVRAREGEFLRSFAKDLVMRYARHGHAKRGDPLYQWVLYDLGLGPKPSSTYPGDARAATEADAHSTEGHEGERDGFSAATSSGSEDENDPDYFARKRGSAGGAA
jgi:hypothetical protein